MPQLLKRALAALAITAAGLALLTGCGSPTPADAPPAPASLVWFYAGQPYCGYLNSPYEIDMYGTIACQRHPFPAATATVMPGSLDYAALTFLTTYDHWYWSGYYYDRYYAPIGPRYHVTVIQRNTFINNSTTFNTRYAGQIKTNTSQAKWGNGKTGNAVTFPTSNKNVRSGPLTGSTTGNTSTRRGGDAGSSLTGGKTGTSSGGTRVSTGGRSR